MEATIVVIGSSNTDMVVVADHFPAPGETILGGKFFMNPGGKGANQAVAAARLGGSVAFISKVGKDIFGQQAVQNLAQVGIDVSAVALDPELPSAVALITVDKHAENCIVVAPGANMSLNRADIDRAEALFNQARFFLLQLETPTDTVAYAVKKAHSMGKKVILNPAPACLLSDDTLQALYAITPNETETELLTGIKVTNEATASQAASILEKKGVAIVVITMGASGAYLHHHGRGQLVPAPVVHAVDTTAAGDTFSGAFTVALANGLPLEEAALFANRAAALAVTKMGAQASIPTAAEVAAAFP
jgi:ribokinase